MTTHDTIEDASFGLLLKADIDDALDDLEKAFGSERAGHKYSSRRRNAKGEWEYEYATDKTKAHAQMAFTFAAAHGTPEQQDRALDVLKRVEPDRWPDHVHAANVAHEAAVIHAANVAHEAAARPLPPSPAHEHSPPAAAAPPAVVRFTQGEPKPAVAAARALDASRASLIRAGIGLRANAEEKTPIEAVAGRAAALRSSASSLFNESIRMGIVNDDPRTARKFTAEEHRALAAAHTALFDEFRELYARSMTMRIRPPSGMTAADADALRSQLERDFKGHAKLAQAHNDAANAASGKPAPAAAVPLVVAPVATSVAPALDAGPVQLMDAAARLIAERASGAPPAFKAVDNNRVTIGGVKMIVQGGFLGDAPAHRAWAETAGTFSADAQHFDGGRAYRVATEAERVAAVAMIPRLRGSVNVNAPAPAPAPAPVVAEPVRPVDDFTGAFRALSDGSGAEEIVTLPSGSKIGLSYVSGQAKARPVGGGIGRKWDATATKRALAAFEAKVAALGPAWHAAHNAMYGVAAAPTPLVVAPVETAAPKRKRANNFETMPDGDRPNNFDTMPEEIKDPSPRATKIRENREAREAEAALEAGAERLTGEERHAALTRMGQHLHEVQDFRAGKDDTGMSGADMLTWRRSTTAPRKASVLRKYRRQLVESFGDLYFKAGLHEKEPIPKGHVPAVGEWTERGGLVIKADGYLGTKFNAWKNLLKEHGFRWNGSRGDESADGMHAEKAALLDIPGFIEAANKIGIHVEIPEKPEVALDAPAAANEPEAPLPTPERPSADRPTTTEDTQRVINAIRAKQGQRGTVAVTVKPDGKFAFYAVDYRKTEVPGSFNHIMSNKNGQITGLMEVDSKDAFSRTTYDAALVTEALGKLRDANPTFHFYIDPKAAAAIDKAGADKAAAEKPIPEVEALLADGFALKPYQNAMVRFLDSNDGNAIVGDEMGLGKTLQSLAWVAKNNKKAIVVVPKVVRRTWIEEAHKFFPGHFNAKELRSKDLLTKKKAKAGKADAGGLSFIDELMATDSPMDLTGKNLVTVNYESLEKFMPYLKAAGFDTIIVDESHRAKNPKAKTTQVIQAIAKTMKHRILMSGTAVKNGKDELFTQLEMVKPGLWGSAKEIKFSTHGAAWNKMRDHYLARSKKNVLKDLPEKTTTISLLYAPGAPDIGKMKEPTPPPANATAKQIAAYEKAAEEWESWMEGAADGDGINEDIGDLMDGGSSIGEYSRVRGQLALAKVDGTVDMVQEILDSSDSKVLVFTESVAAAKAIAEKLGSEAILHYGQQSDDKREDAKKEFQREGSPKRVFVSTRPSLAVGATLTAADKVVFNDLPWTAADVRQAEDRAHRVGQKNAVNVYWNVAEDNKFDENVSAILRRKYDLSKKINEGQQLSPEEKAWMSKPVTMREVMDRIKGKPSGPPEPKIEKSAKAQLRDMTRALIKAAS